MQNTLTVTLGKDEKSKVITDDITTMPHMLIGGTTGSGKSTFLHNLLTTLMENYTTKELQLFIIDPKRVEFIDYNGLPHLALPVVTTPERALAVLQYMVKTMQKRYSMLEQAHCRSLAEYNAIHTPLPRYLIVIDELADLMNEYSKYFQHDIQRLCQLARAVGIHIILATQHPSVKVIPGVIKANIPTRLAFRTRSLSDSRVILDIRGAEKLPPRGVMLFSSPKHMDLTRVSVPNITSNQLQKRLQKLHNVEEVIRCS